MKPRFKIGLVVGAIGLVLNTCVSTFVGTNGGLIIFILTSGVAGFFATQREKPTTKQIGARVGAIAGSIAGILVVAGQICSAILILLAPPSAAELATPGLSNQIGYELGEATNISICVGFPLTIIIGLCVGYLATPKQNLSTKNSVNG